MNLEMAKILKEKGFNDVLPGQKLCRQCVTKYEKLTKPPKNEKRKLKKVLNVQKENILAAYVSGIETEEPSPIYDRDTKKRAEELGRLQAAIKEKLGTASNTEKF